MKKMLQATAVLATALTSTVVAAPATAAPTIGDTVSCFSFDLTCSAGLAVVGAGNEFTLNGQLGADFSNNLLTLSNISGADFSSMNATVLFSDETSRFTAATVLSSVGVTNFGTATLNSNGALRIQFSNTTTTFAPGGSINIALAPIAAVPELATWAMFITGFGLAGAALRRRKLAVRFA